MYIRVSNLLLSFEFYLNAFLDVRTLTESVFLKLITNLIKLVLMMFFLRPLFLPEACIGFSFGLVLFHLKFQHVVLTQCFG